MGKRLRDAVRALPPQAQAALRRKLFYEPLIRHRGLSAENPGFFDAVFFEVVTRCNSRCSFCAASIQNEKREPRSMEFALYAKVVDELAEHGFGGRVAWHVNNDPLLFPDLPRFVAYARERLPQAWLQVMTNGILLKPAIGEALIAAGVDDVHVDFYRSRPDQPLYPGLKAFIEETIPKHFPVRQGHVHLSADGRRKLTFEMEQRFLGEVISSRGGTSPNRQAQPAEIGGFCILPWTQFNVTADGRVNKCCADFYFADPMGDMNTQGVMEIWRGKPFTHVRERLLAFDRQSLPNCRQCDYFGFPNKIFPNKLMRAVRHHFFTCRDVHEVEG